MAVLSLMPAMFIAVLLAGSSVLPPWLPPRTEDPLLARIAPEHCLWYVASAGSTDADPASRNQFEQLVAEDEVRLLRTTLSEQLESRVVAQSRVEVPGGDPKRGRRSGGH